MGGGGGFIFISFTKELIMIVKNMNQQLAVDLSWLIVNIINDAGRTQAGALTWGWPWCRHLFGIFYKSRY